MIDVKCGELCSEDDDVVATYTQLLRSTEKAVQVEFPDLTCWVPFSQIVEHDEWEQTLRVTRWFADREGIEEDEE